jgi:hypothetical protein
MFHQFNETLFVAVALINLLHLSLLVAIEAHATSAF